MVCGEVSMSFPSQHAEKLCAAQPPPVVTRTSSSSPSLETFPSENASVAGAPVHRGTAIGSESDDAGALVAHAPSIINDGKIANLNMSSLLGGYLRRRWCNQHTAAESTAAGPLPARAQLGRRPVRRRREERPRRD